MTPNQNPEISAYTFNEHKHRYAVWTAARAVQRSFTTTENIQRAIETTDIRTFAETGKTVSAAAYDALHEQWCLQLISSFLPGVICSYGRAAKMIAIYLKTSVILPTQGASALCDVIHPPLDSTLLNRLAKEKGLEALAAKRWTQFDDKDYREVVRVIRGKNYPFNWRLETFWQPHLENKSIYTINGRV
jgi:hypothetical protein